MMRSNPQLVALKTVISGSKSGITDETRVLTRRVSTSLLFVNIKTREHEQTER